MGMADLGLRLAGLPVFGKLAEEDRRKLARLAVCKHYEKGDFIFRQGEHWAYVMYLAEGRLGWSILSEDGRRQALHEVREGEMVWGHSFFDDLPAPADLEARELSLVFRWDRQKIASVVSRSVDAVWDVSRHLAGATRRAREIVYGFAFKTAAQRLASLLLSRYPYPEGQPAPRDMTLDEMAGFVGVTPALICRLLYGFAERGMIRLTRAEFEFLDRKRLEVFVADGNRSAA